MTPLRRLLPRLSSCAAALAAVLALTSTAAADEPSDGAQAQSLFVAGRTALEKGDYPTACARFTQSLALVQRAGTLLNLAQCEEHESKLVSATRHWKEGIAMLPPGDERLAVSQQRAAALAPRLAHLAVTLALPPPAGARVELDGAAVPLDALAAGVPADPGQHTLVLLVAGRPDQRSTVDLVEGQIKIVSLSVAPAAPPSPPAPPPPAVRSGGSGGLRTAGFGVLGVGVAGVIVAGVTGGILVARHNQIDSAGYCPGMVCTPAGRSLIDSTGALNAANGVAWGVGIAGIAAGVALVIVGGNTPTSIAPAPLTGGGGLWMTTQF